MGTVLVSVIICLPYSYAQYEKHTQWALPEGAKARLGKGKLSEKPTYSPDGARLALGSSIGVWLIDVDTGEEVAFLAGHTDAVLSVAYSPDGMTLVTGEPGCYGAFVGCCDWQTQNYTHRTYRCCLECCV